MRWVAFKQVRTDRGTRCVPAFVITSPQPRRRKHVQRFARTQEDRLGFRLERVRSIQAIEEQSVRGRGVGCLFAGLAVLVVVMVMRGFQWWMALVFVVILGGLGHAGEGKQAREWLEQLPRLPQVTMPAGDVPSHHSRRGRRRAKEAATPNAPGPLVCARCGATRVGLFCGRCGTRANAPSDDDGHDFG